VAYSLRLEEPEDVWEVEALFDLCFVPGREALSSYRLRDGVAALGTLCLVARDADAVLAGALRVWPVQIETIRAEQAPALLVGPIAVHPTRQGEGLGGLMIETALARARDAGWARAMLVGDAPYYRRFGFAPLAGVEMPPPTNPDRILGVALTEGAWAGISGKVLKAR
jgi:predicted N-acetyltransferase YhbS